MSAAPCRFFLQGNCKNGSDCRFSHAIPSTDTARGPPPSSKKNKPPSSAGHLAASLKQTPRGVTAAGQPHTQNGAAIGVRSGTWPTTAPARASTNAAQSFHSGRVGGGDTGRKKNPNVSGNFTSQPRRNSSGPAAKKICKSCGRRFKPGDYSQFSCCQGKTRRDYPTFPSVELIKYCTAGKSKWHANKKKKLPSTGGNVLKFTELSTQIEKDILSFLQNISADGIRAVPMHGHATSPWSIRASDMTSGGSLLDCFGAKAKMFGAPRTLTSASIGGILHSLLDAGCAVGGSLGPNWGVAKSKFTTIDTEGLGIRVHGSCDAVYMEQFPIELKTVDDMKQVDSAKIRHWLLQIAVYQSLYSKSLAVLVIICRKTYEITAFEVQKENLDHSVDAWRHIVSKQPLLGECIALTQPYCLALEEQRNRPLTSADNPRLFLELLEQSISVFFHHTTLVLVTHRAQLASGNIIAAIESYLRGTKYLKMLKAAVEVTGSAVSGLEPLETSAEASKQQTREAAEASMARGEGLASLHDADSVKASYKAFVDAMGLFSAVMGAQSAQTQAARKKKLEMKSKLHDIGFDTPDLDAELEAILRDEGVASEVDQEEDPEGNEDEIEEGLIVSGVHGIQLS